MSEQKFVNGEPPTQQEVDDFLLSEDIEPVKRLSCWLWKRRDQEAEVDFWIGDARADNFVKTQTGIVPIDLRMWGVVLNEESDEHLTPFPKRDSNWHCVYAPPSDVDV